jgi:hypothetical protein
MKQEVTVKQKVSREVCDRCQKPQKDDAQKVLITIGADPAFHIFLCSPCIGILHTALKKRTHKAKAKPA